MRNTFRWFGQNVTLLQRNCRRCVRQVLLIAMTTGVLSITAASAATHRSTLTGTGGVLPPTVPSPLLGAYYSDWFPANSTQGTLRQHLVPSPRGGSDNGELGFSKVAQEAIAQASKAGISFFRLDYWPSRPAQNANIDAFLKARNLNDIHFCLLYETSDLGFDAGSEATPVTPSVESTFDSQLLQFAETYFTNPQYLRVGGRPVLVLYLSRTLTGDVSGMITQARDLLRQHGFDPFLIGDEVFWRVTSENPPTTGLAFTKMPQVARIDDLMRSPRIRSMPGGQAVSGCRQLTLSGTRVPLRSCVMKCRSIGNIRKRPLAGSQLFPMCRLESTRGEYDSV